MQAPPTALIFSSATLLKNLALTMTGKRLKICRSQDQVSGQDLSSTTIYWGYLLSSEDASTTDSLDLLLRDPAEEPGLDNHWLLGKNTLAEHLAEASPRDVDNRGLTLHAGILEPSLLRDEGPEFVQVDSGLVEVGVVGVHVEVPHANLSEVSGMVLVEVDPVVVLTTSVSTTSRMLPVLADPAVTMRDVSSQLPGLLLAGGHLSCRSESSNKSLVVLDLQDASCAC